MVVKRGGWGITYHTVFPLIRAVNPLLFLFFFCSLTSTRDDRWCICLKVEAFVKDVVLFRKTYITLYNFQSSFLV